MPKMFNTDGFGEFSVMDHLTHSLSM